MLERSGFTLFLSIFFCLEEFEDVVVQQGKDFGCALSPGGGAGIEETGLLRGEIVLIGEPEANAAGK